MNDLFIVCISRGIKYYASRKISSKKLLYLEIKLLDLVRFIHHVSLNLWRGSVCVSDAYSPHQNVPHRSP